MEKVYYLNNADGDPTNLDRKGYFYKHKDKIEKQTGIVLKKRGADATHIPQDELMIFLGGECDKYLSYCDEKSNNYCHYYYIDIEVLKKEKQKSIFLEIILEAYLSKDLSSQIGKVYFCSREN